MKTKAIPRKTYKLLVKKLSEYKYLQDELIAAEGEEGSKDVNYGIRSKNKINDSVANIAANLADNLYYQETKAWKECIDQLLILYINDPPKLKFLKRRYIDGSLVNYAKPKKYCIKDIYVMADLEFEGYTYSEKTWRRIKQEIICNFYKIVKENIYLKKYTNF